MMPAPRKVTPEQEETIWLQYLERVPQASIARTVHVNRNTVSAVIARIKRELAEGRRAEMDEAREEALAVYDAVQRECWERLKRVAPNSTASVGYLSNIVTARQAQDRLLGLETITVNHRAAHLVRLEAALGQGVSIVLPGGVIDGN